MKADLHSHTVLSDGALNVDQLISQAKRVGLDYIAVTDHNSTHSIPAVLALGKELGSMSSLGSRSTLFTRLPIQNLIFSATIPPM